MKALNFSIKDGIYFVINGQALDIHNDYEFVGHSQDKTKKSCELTWLRCTRQEVNRLLPSKLLLRINGVRSITEIPRDPSLPRSEDSCLNDVQYISEDKGGTQEFQADGQANPEWKWGFLFMSKAELIIDASEARIDVVP